MTLTMPTPYWRRWPAAARPGYGDRGAGEREGEAEQPRRAGQREGGRRLVEKVCSEERLPEDARRESGNFKMQMQHPLELLQCLFSSHFADASCFEERSPKQYFCAAQFDSKLNNSYCANHHVTHTRIQSNCTPAEPLIPAQSRISVFSCSALSHGENF
jgi:hypothetical protein